MEFWGRLTQLLFRLIDEYDEPAIAVFLLLEEAGLPLPVPGDVVMLLAGYRIAQGEMNLLWTLFLLEVATLLGTSILYWLGNRGGRPLLYRYGRYLHCDPPKLDRLEAWLQRRGALAVFLGRIIPGLRIITPLAAGAFGVPYRIFLPPLAIGSFIYITAFVLVGMWVGPHAIEVLEGLHLSARAVMTGVLFVVLSGILLMLYRRAARNHQLPDKHEHEPGRLETAVQAGLLATFEMLLGVNLLLYLLSAVGILRPELALLQFAELAADRYAGGSIIRLMLLVLVLVVLGNVLWAVLYVRVGIEYLPGSPWVEGLLFSAVPFAVSVLVLLPLLGGGPLGLGLGAGLMPLAGEVFRNALFGVGLGVTYALLRGAQIRPAAAAATPIVKPAASASTDQGSG
jgi:membrane protein DedA with SNARE-associated domain